MAQLVDMMLRAGVLTPAQAQEARQQQVVYGDRIGTNLIDLGMVDETLLCQALGTLHNVPYAVGAMAQTSPTLARTLHGASAARLNAVPARWDGRVLHVFMMDPRNPRTVAELEQTLRRLISPVVVAEARMWDLLSRYYGVRRGFRALALDGDPMAKARQLLKKAAAAPAPAPAASDASSGELSDEGDFMAIYQTSSTGGMSAVERAVAMGEAAAARKAAGGLPYVVPTPAPVAPVAPPVPPAPPAAPSEMGEILQGVILQGTLVDAPLPPEVSAPAPQAPVAPVAPAAHAAPAQPPARPPALPSAAAAPPPAALLSPPSLPDGPAASFAPPPVPPLPAGTPQAHPSAQPLAHASAQPAAQMSAHPSAHSPLPGVVTAQPTAAPSAASAPPVVSPPPVPRDSAPPAMLGTAASWSAEEAPWSADGGPEPAPEPTPEEISLELDVLPPRPASPLDFAQARELLAGATDRNEIARTVLRYAITVFKRAVLMTVQKDLAVGWDGLGQGVHQEQVEQIILPLQQQSIFRLARDSRAHFLGPVPKQAVNYLFLKLLGGKLPRSAFLIPVVVRGRVVNLLYADNGGGQEAGADIGELLILAQHINRSYESLLGRAQ